MINNCLKNPLIRKISIWTTLIVGFIGSGLFAAGQRTNHKEDGKDWFLPKKKYKGILVGIGKYNFKKISREDIENEEKMYKENYKSIENVARFSFFREAIGLVDLKNLLLEFNFQEDLIIDNNAFFKKRGEDNMKLLQKTLKAQYENKDKDWTKPFKAWFDIDIEEVDKNNYSDNYNNNENNENNANLVRVMPDYEQKLAALFAEFKFKARDYLSQTTSKNEKVFKKNMDIIEKIGNFDAFIISVQEHSLGGDQEGLCKIVRLLWKIKIKKCKDVNMERGKANLMILKEAMAHKHPKFGQIEFPENIKYHIQAWVSPKKSEVPRSSDTESRGLLTGVFEFLVIVGISGIILYKIFSKFDTKPDPVPVVEEQEKKIVDKALEVSEKILPKNLFKKSTKEQKNMFIFGFLALMALALLILLLRRKK